MMTKLRTVFGAAAAVLAAFLAIGGTALAAAPQGGGRETRPGTGRSGGPPPNAEEMRQALEQTMIARMRQILRLTPRQEEKVIPQVRSLLQVRREFAARRRAAMSHLRALLIDETADEPSIDKALRDVQSIDERFQDRQRGLKEAIDSGLTPRQRARLLIFEEHFRRTMQRRLREAARGAGVSPPAEEPDDDLDSVKEEP